MINPNWPAFAASPCATANNDLLRPADIGNAGIDIRTYIATAMLQGMLSDSACNGTKDSLVDSAVEIADALIARLNESRIKVEPL